MFIDKETIDAGSLHNGHTTVGTSVTKLADEQFVANKGILLRCPGSTDPVPNTAPIWFGGPSITADSSPTGGMPILPGDTAFIPLESVDQLYVISSANGQDIAWMSI